MSAAWIWLTASIDAVSDGRPSPRFASRAATIARHPLCQIGISFRYLVGHPLGALASARLRRAVRNGI
ncbi:MAG: hypothetical protein OJF60_003398 [Burkholderiaceae bacterium]|nr:MAG: hypothetical protein OJF60_003398 [Burkholderiaceae bacterium]